MHSGLIPVTFRYPRATSGPVALVGSFNHWDSRAHLLQPTDGEWRITIYLPPGTYPYAFLVEGRRTHPGLNESRRDPLAGQYSTVAVGTPVLARAG